MPIQSFHDLTVWHKSVALVDAAYRLSTKLPAEERYGITRQMRRAVVSVASNIAEGSGRASTPDLKNFLSIARGSLKETESLILICIKLNFLSRADAEHSLQLCNEVSKMLAGLRASLQK